MLGAWWPGASTSARPASSSGKCAELDITTDGKIDMAVATNQYGKLFQHVIWQDLTSAASALLQAPVMKRRLRAAR